jgi:hypothetical protein
VQNFFEDFLIQQGAMFLGLITLLLVAYLFFNAVLDDRRK